MSTIVEARNARFVSGNDASLRTKPFVHFVPLMSPEPHGIPFGLQVVPILVLLPLLLILLLVVLLLFTIAIANATATAPTAAIGAAAARLLLLLVLLLLLRLLLRGVGYRDHTIGAGGSSTRNM